MGKEDGNAETMPRLTIGRYKQAGGSVGDKKSGALDTAEFYNVIRPSTATPKPSC